jgi:hypothetical protein
MLYSRKFHFMAVSCGMPGSDSAGLTDQAGLTSRSVFLSQQINLKNNIYETFRD